MTLRSRYALGLLAAALITLLVLQTPLLASARGAAWSLWINRVGRWFRIGPLAVPNNVEEQLKTLTAENARLRSAALDLARLREQLGSPAYEEFAAIPAEVGTQPLDPFQAQLVVNRGAADGIRLGAPAVVAGSTLVGLITDLGEHTATLQLLFHPATNVPVEVLTEAAPSQGLLRGKTFTTIEVTSVPRDVTLQAGQTVVTTSQPAHVPPGLLIGRITEIADEENEPFQLARIMVPYDPSRLYAVSILVPHSVP